MSRSIILGTAAATILAAAPLQTAIAQADPPREPAITVFAPRVVEEPSSDGIGKVRTLTTSSVVYADDLNLNTASGREALKQRVETAAEETCEWLNDLYPLDHPIGSERGCIEEAVEGAEEQMLAAIADYR